MSDLPPIGDPSEMFRQLPFPFRNNQFPVQLGVVVQRTIVEGKEPIREVIHTDDNSWLVGDGVNDPNAPDAATVFHIHHLLESDPTLEEMASLPLGHMATRDGAGRPWIIGRHVWPSEP